MMEDVIETRSREERLAEHYLERDIAFLQPKGTRAKADIIAMRRSRAQLLRFLTPEMVDAEYEIERAFNIDMGGMGYGNSDPNRVKGRGEMSDEQALMHKKWIDYLTAWQRACPSNQRGVVIDMIVFGFSVKQIQEQRCITRKTVTRRYRNGLNEYCKIRGWRTE